MNLENLVPPLELCKQIPAGHFEDSALVWFGHDRQDDMKVLPREELGPVCLFFVDKGLRAVYQAPTLSEIMVALSRYEPVIVTQWRTGQVSVVVKRDGTECEEVSEDSATAALKLWLDLEAGK